MPIRLISAHVFAAFMVLISGCGAAHRTRAITLGEIRIAALGDTDATGFAELKAQYEAANPDTSIAWHPGVQVLEPSAADRIIFVHGQDQHGRTRGLLIEPAAGPVSVGDLIMLRAFERLQTDGGPLDLLAFKIEAPLPAALPTVIRPDNDPRISDTPGGCATDADAYRRVALTWLSEKGPYVYHGLNAHRVLITDSFTHYHPVDTGWDEFYLVQDVRGDGGLWVSRQTNVITNPTEVSADAAKDLLRWIPLETGDLVLLPRGTVHRGKGGVLVHVLAVPGFVPNNEIPVDDDLRAINERLGLTGDAALPCHNCVH